MSSYEGRFAKQRRLERERAERGEVSEVVEHEQKVALVATRELGMMFTFDDGSEFALVVTCTPDRNDPKKMNFSFRGKGLAKASSDAARFHDAMLKIANCDSTLGYTVNNVKWTENTRRVE